MTPIRVGLMGFGRIGRNLFRLLYRSDEIRLAGICDIADQRSLEYLLRFDTILGRFPDELSIADDNLYVVGRQIPMLSDRDPGDADWAALGVDVVIEATGKRRTRAEVERHLERGARRVIMCVPPTDSADVTIVMGINDDHLRPEHRIVSAGSCTAHCVAPVAQVLHEAFGIETAFLTTVHAYTNQQRLADVPADDKRRGRAAAENIIPQETNAAKVLMELLPALAGRIRGMAMNVPVANGSVVDLVCWHERRVTVASINEVMRTAATGRYDGLLDYEDAPIVSSDIVRSPTSSTFDSLATMVLRDRVSKTLSWYDNSWGYTHRVVELIHRLASLDGEES